MEPHSHRAVRFAFTCAFLLLLTSMGWVINLLQKQNDRIKALETAGGNLFGMVSAIGPQTINCTKDGKPCLEIQSTGQIRLADSKVTIDDAASAFWAWAGNPKGKLTLFRFLYAVELDPVTKTASLRPTGAAQVPGEFTSFWVEIAKRAPTPVKAKARRHTDE